MAGSDDIASMVSPAEREVASALMEQIRALVQDESSTRPGLEDLMWDRILLRMRSIREEERVPALKAVLAEAQLESLSREALVLAIARYVRDGNALSKAGARWITPDVQRVRDWPIGEIERVASQRESELGMLQERVERHLPEVWVSHRRLVLPIRQALASARTGSFGTSTGSLHDFLEDNGAESSLFDVF